MSSKSYKSFIHIHIVALIFIILIFSTFKLQVLEGKKFAQIAEKNYVRVRTISPVRGGIYDRNYQPIADNRPSFNLYVLLGKVLDKERLIDFISNEFDVDRGELKKEFHDNRFRLYKEILLVQDVSYEKMVNTSELLNEYPSLSFKTESIRQTRYNNHFTGYVGRINETEHKELKEKGYSINSIIGKTGLEKMYEEKLSGKNGFQMIQVDATGKSLDLFKHNLTKPPQNGHDLILTIDNELQSYIHEIFPEDENGSVVVMDVETGGILAYVSEPDFDPGIFVNRLTVEQWKALNEDPRKPMLDRVIRGTYPPGSVYKPIIASLGLDKEIITPTTRLANCEGGLQVGDRFFKCWIKTGHGRLNVIDAIKYSCDVFFYDLSLKLELEEIEIYTKNNFLTRKTNIDLPGERNGFFPNLAWYRANYGKYVGIIGPKVNISIGQGEVLVNPLQMCAYYNAIANDGVWVQPHLLEKEIWDSGASPFVPETGHLTFKPTTMEIIQESLYKATNERYGTGTVASFSDKKVFAKTGSAENHMGDLTHAWFSGYVEWDGKPQISFNVFVENGGHGGSVAAPIAAKFIDFYHKLSTE